MQPGYRRRIQRDAATDAGKLPKTITDTWTGREKKAGVVLLGKRLGDFEIVREPGRGGMGVVCEAVQTSLHRRVALKILSPGLGLTPPAVERFPREAAAAARLHHTNIVPDCTTGEENGLHFYAMESIDGSTPCKR